MNWNMKWSKTHFYSFRKEEHAEETFGELLLSAGERV